jgi:hypothetical protein
MIDTLFATAFCGRLLIPGLAILLAARRKVAGITDLALGASAAVGGEDAYGYRRQFGRVHRSPPLRLLFVDETLPGPLRPVEDSWPWTLILREGASFSHQA